jgi:hypothetical protein
MKNTIFWDISSCGSFKVKRRFGGTYHLNLQDRKMSQARNKRVLVISKGGLLLSAFFDLEDGSNMFLRNVG